MKVIQNLAAAGCTVFLLCQCASQDEIRDLNYQIRAVNQRVEEVKSTTVNNMQKRQASSVSKIDQVEEENLRLKSLIEENTHQSTLFREQTKENLATLQSSIDALRVENEQKISQLEQQVAQVTGSFDRLQQARIQDAEERAKAAARRAEEAKRRSMAAASSSGGNRSVRVKPSTKKKTVSSGQVAPSAPAQKTQPAASATASAPKKSVAAVEKVTTPDLASEPFAKGVSLFDGKKYKEAYRTFEQVLATNPKGGKAAETLFYMGECLYNQGEYDLAILDYQKVISNHSKHSLTPSALLKQGMSFEKLTDHETAKIIYKKLIGEYASSSEAGQAKDRLGKL